MLNVKGIIAKLYCDGPKTVYIEASGEGTVTAGDIHTDGEVEILNPELHIATLMSDAHLSMEITLTNGRGYVSAERNKQYQTAIGVIPVDSIYTPVYKVNYTVENTRVGNMTDYDKLTLEVWTDRTITAKDAVSLGAKVLTDHLSLFVDLSEEIGSHSTVVEKAETQHDKVLEMTIEELDLSVRSFNCLKRAGINTVEDLINTSEDDMMKVVTSARSLWKKLFTSWRQWVCPLPRTKTKQPEPYRGTRLLPGAPPRIDRPVPKEVIFSWLETVNSAEPLTIEWQCSEQW